MQIPGYLIWVVLLPISGGVGEMPELDRVSAQVGCEIRATNNPSGTRLDAVISASGAVKGTYSFEVNSRSGQKMTSKTGDFKIESTAPSEIKTAGLDLPPGQGFEASLTIKWQNGTSSCSASVS